MVKIFYYDDDTENLFAEEDAAETTLDEAMDELFNLADDDTSYVGFITPGGRYKVKSDDYDSYKFYRFDERENDYVMFDMGDFEKCRSFIEAEFAEQQPAEKITGTNRWLPPDWKQ